MLSQTTEYAFRAMMVLAALEPQAALNSQTIAVRTKAPHGYLAKILRDLVVAGLVTSQRGPNGGFALARPADQVSMLDVVNAVDPIRRLTRCPLGNPNHHSLCPLHRRIDDAMDMIEMTFRNTSLAEVLEGSGSGHTCQTLVKPVLPSVGGRKGV